MRLDLLAAKRDQASANKDRIKQLAETLKLRINAQRDAEAKQAKTAAEQMVRATAGLDPALARLAEQNAAITQALANIAEQTDRLDAEQQKVERLSARTAANFQRAQTAKAVGVPAEGLGQLLLEHRAALPDSGIHAHRAVSLAQQIAAVTLSRLRHLEDVERLTDPAMADPRGADPHITAGPVTGDSTSTDMRQELLEQRLGLIQRQLEGEDRFLERQRKLQTAESEMLGAVDS